MPLKFTTTDRAGSLHGVKALVYGSAGAGKTTLCSTAPTPIIFSAEAGLLSLRHHSIPVVLIESINDLHEAYTWALGSAEAKDFETFCLDSISEVAEVILTDAKRRNKDPRHAYGELSESTMTLLRRFRDIPNRHVLMSAKMAPIKDELNGNVTYVPSMPGRQLDVQLPYLFDEVFRLGIDKLPDGRDSRFLQTVSDFQYIAKDRSGALDAREKPDFAYLIQKIAGGADPKTS